MTRMNTLTVCSVVLTIFVADGLIAQNHSFAAGHHVQVFAEFDEVYIPALALTKQEKADPSRAAFRRLSERWQKTRTVCSVRKP